MNSRKLLVSTAMTAVLLLGLAAGLAAAQAPVDEAAPAGTEPAAVEAVLGTAASTPLSTGFTYQGQLIQDGTPADGTCDMRFTLYDAATGGTAVGDWSQAAVPVSAGLFTVKPDFGSSPFTGQARWLGLDVQCAGDSGLVTVGGRQALTATPYALYSAGNWALTGNAGTTPGTHYLGTSDYQALELKVNGARALRIEPNATIPNLIGGYSGNSVTGGALGAAIGGGGGASAGVNRVTDDYGTVGGGASNTAGDNAGPTDSSAYATVGGGQSNTASGAGATVGGGGSNQAIGQNATVGGGDANVAMDANATVGGGENNGAYGFSSTVGGGDENGTNADYATVGGGGFSIAGGDYATVAGGMGNLASAYIATVGGGGNNSAAAQFGTIAGGGSDDPATGNRVTDDYGSVGGGYNNQAGDNAGTAIDKAYATVAGGAANTASGGYAAVGGGAFNKASGGYAAVGGGYSVWAVADYATASGGYANNATGQYAFVGGGNNNQAGGSASAVVGGWTNKTTGMYAFVGAGSSNTASGFWATVPGGDSNTASGYYSFAAGRRAKATHNGSFVWADSTDADFVSGAENEFALRAAGGVRMVVGTGTGALRLEPNPNSPNLVGGYSGNAVTAGVYGATIGGGGNNGHTNRVTDSYGTVGGGANNRAGNDAGTTSAYATVGGGGNNQANSGYATVGGGGDNQASGVYATVGGGWINRANGHYATIPGGAFNEATGLYSFAAGRQAKALGDGSFVWADSTNANFTSSAANEFRARASGGVTFAVGTGAWRIEANATSPNLIGGYSGNVVTAGVYGATIAGGGLAGSDCGFGSSSCQNQVQGLYGTVGGGRANTAAGAYAVVGGGSDNTAGAYGTVPGGAGNTAGGNYSFAAGYRAHASHKGSFVWADSNLAEFASTAVNQFLVRASGGITMYTDAGLTAGVQVGPGGNAWSSASDRNLKENFAGVNGQALLDQLAKTPVTTWNYKSQDAAIRHMGPVAQDFYAAFGVGEDDTHITTIDADGVALAASQALYTLAQEQASQISALQAQNAALEARLAALEARAAARPAVGTVVTRPGGAQ